MTKIDGDAVRKIMWEKLSTVESMGQWLERLLRKQKREEDITRFLLLNVLVIDLLIIAMVLWIFT